MHRIRKVQEKIFAFLYEITRCDVDGYFEY
jgi:hypothetical protein